MENRSAELSRHGYLNRKDYSPDPWSQEERQSRRREKCLQANGALDGDQRPGGMQRAQLLDAQNVISSA